MPRNAPSRPWPQHTDRRPPRKAWKTSAKGNVLSAPPLRPAAAGPRAGSASAQPAVCAPQTSGLRPRGSEMITSEQQGGTRVAFSCPTKLETSSGKLAELFNSDRDHGHFIVYSVKRGRPHVQNRTSQQASGAAPCPRRVCPCRCPAGAVRPVAPLPTVRGVAGPSEWRPRRQLSREQSGQCSSHPVRCGGRRWRRMHGQRPRYGNHAQHGHTSPRRGSKAYTYGRKRWGRLHESP